MLAPRLQGRLRHSAYLEEIQGCDDLLEKLSVDPLCARWAMQSEKTASCLLCVWVACRLRKRGDQDQRCIAICSDAVQLRQTLRCELHAERWQVSTAWGCM